MVGTSLAAMVEQRHDCTEAELAAWMGAMLRREEGIFGLCLAFEPGQFRADQEDYGLYQYRVGPHDEFATMHLIPPKYPYRELDWYTRARAKGEALWTTREAISRWFALPFLSIGSAVSRAW